MKQYYFYLGFCTAILIMIFIITWYEPLNASSCEPGSAEWCPLYVKVVD